MAAWFGGSHEGANDVVIWTCLNYRRRWTKPIAVANGIINDSLRYPCWNPVLFKDNHNVLYLYYKIGPNPREWWGMEITSNDNGKNWSKPIRLKNGFLGPIKNKPVQLADGTILLPSSIESKTERWSAHIERSTDGGKTWIFIPIDASGKYDVIQPSILTYPNGKLQIVCRSKQGYVMQSWSTDSGKSWSEIYPTMLINPNSGTDAVTLRNGLQMIVYNPDIPGKEWYNGRSKLRVAISKDGNIWKDIITLENRTNGEYSYPAIIQTKNGDIHITYTFDRKNIKHVVLREID